MNGGLIKRLFTIIMVLISIHNVKAQQFTVKPMTEERLKTIAITADKSCPEILNKDTRLDSVRYLKGLILCNYYTMPNATAEDVARARMHSGDDKNDEGVKLPNSTYRVQHKFYDKNGVYIFTKTQWQ
ncbi:MAG: hypothetical protein R2800_04990 [Flavipsychrobacter sp.]